MTKNLTAFLPNRWQEIKPNMPVSEWPDRNCSVCYFTVYMVCFSLKCFFGSYIYFCFAESNSAAVRALFILTFSVGSVCFFWHYLNSGLLFIALQRPGRGTSFEGERSAQETRTATGREAKGKAPVDQRRHVEIRDINKRHYNYEEGWWRLMTVVELIDCDVFCYLFSLLSDIVTGQRQTTLK